MSKFLLINRYTTDPYISRQAWLNYFLINISGWPSKFYPNNCFGETIIKLNKKEVCLLSNAKLDVFLRKTVTLNVISLWKSKKVLFQTTDVTFHGNCHFFIENHPNIRFLIELIIESLVFLSQSGQTSKVKEFKDLFTIGSIIIEKIIPINWYKNQA